MLKKEKNPISKVVFYEIEFEGEKICEAAIFRKNGIQLEDKESGIEALYELAKEKGCSSIKELENMDCFEVLSEKDLKEKYPKIYKVAMCNDDNQNPELDQLQEKTESAEDLKNDDPNYLQDLLDKFPVKKILVKAAIYCITGGFILVGGYKLGRKVFQDSEDSVSKKNTNQEELTTAVNFDVDKTKEYETAEDMLAKYGSVDEILEQSHINQTKATTLSDIWSYLKHYNKTISNQHKNNLSDTRLAHTWDEVVIDYLAYNDISKDEVAKVFEHYNIDTNILKEAYQSGYKQDILAYTVVTESTNKTDIINSQEGKEFYQKYENLIIKYNKTYDNMNNENDLEKIINKFYKTIRSDFDIQQSKETVEDYKLSVIPIIIAYDNMLKNSECDYKLTIEEKSYFNELADFSIFENKIRNLSDSLYAYNLGTTVLDENKEEYTYSQIKDAAITELDNDYAYNIDENERDISDHSEYQSKFEIKIEDTYEQTINEYNKDSNSHNNDDAGMVDDDGEEDKIPDWMLEDNPQEDENRVNTESEEEQTNSDDIYDVEEDTPTQNDENNQPNNDDSIKDITPDDSDVDINNPLPNPNGKSLSEYQLSNQVIAEKMIDYMVHNLSTIGDNYQYKKNSIFK